MIILTYNIRGGGSSAKRRQIIQIIEKVSLTFCLTQESKLESISKNLVESFWRNEEIDFSVSDSVGSSGGMLIIWKKMRWNCM